MDDFVYGSLRIKIEDNSEGLRLNFFGKSDTREPANVLTPYFEKVLNTDISGHLSIDFSRLEFMNSSTMSPIVRFMNLLNKKGQPTTLYYDASTKWQDISFKAIKKIAETMPHIAIKPAEN